MSSNHFWSFNASPGSQSKAPWTISLQLLIASPRKWLLLTDCSETGALSATLCNYWWYWCRGRPFETTSCFRVWMPSGHPRFGAGKSLVIEYQWPSVFAAKFLKSCHLQVPSFQFSLRNISRGSKLQAWPPNKTYIISQAFGWTTQTADRHQPKRPNRSGIYIYILSQSHT